MDWLIYTGALSFGAVALLIEARRNYRESLTQTPFQRHPILQNAQVSDLCTPRDGFAGFLIYSMLYLVSYIVILSSAELFDLLRSANLAKLEVGATTAFDPFGDDILNIENTVYAKPIFVSALLIAIMSVGAMRPIENTVRSAAHRLAGIPRGVYRVIDALQTTAFQRLVNKRKRGSLSAYFHTKFEKAKDIPPDLAGYTDEIDQALRSIDLLSPAITPNRRAQHFPAAELDKLLDMATQLQEELSILNSQLLAFDFKDTDALRKLHENAVRVANNCKALFAVHYIRNNRSVKNCDHGTPLHAVIKIIDRNYNPEQNSFALAVFISVFLTFSCTFLVYDTWYHKEVAVNPGRAASQIETIIDTGDLPFEATDCLVGEPKTEIKEQCQEVLEEGKSDYLFAIRPELAAEAFWDTLKTALITLAAVGAVTFGRDVRIEQESWKPGWSFNRMPFLRLLGLCIIPGGLACLAAVLGSLLELWVENGFDITQTQLIILFGSERIYFFMMPVVGFTLAFGTLVILDKHDDLNMARTVFFLAVPTAIAVGLAWASVVYFSYNFPDYYLFDNRWFSYKTRDWLILSMHPMLFIVLFALLIEFTEEEDPDSEQPQSNWFMRLFRGQTTVTEVVREPAE